MLYNSHTAMQEFKKIPVGETTGHPFQKWMFRLGKNATALQLSKTVTVRKSMKSRISNSPTVV
jgi:hypothetical protein